MQCGQDAEGEAGVEGESGQRERSVGSVGERRGEKIEFRIA